jgi:hypothetical protein
VVVSCQVWEKRQKETDSSMPENFRSLSQNKLGYLSIASSKD